jgi:lysozyme family protein
LSLPIRSLLLPLALVVVSVSALVSARPADAATCWQRVLSDWKDGRIDGTYSSSCLRAAIVNMPEDLKIYGDAVDDITRLLNSQASRLAAKQAAPSTRRATPTTTRTSTSTTTTTKTSRPAASSGARSLEGRKHKRTAPAQARRVAAAPEQDVSAGGFPYRTLLLILAAASAVSVLGLASVRGLRG